MIALSVTPSEFYESGKRVKTTSWLERFGSGATFHQLLLAWDWKPSHLSARAQCDTYAAFVSRRLSNVTGLGMKAQEGESLRVKNTSCALSEWKSWMSGWRFRAGVELYPCPFRTRNPLRFNCWEWEYCARAPYNGMAELK